MSERNNCRDRDGWLILSLVSVPGREQSNSVCDDKSMVEAARITEDRKVSLVEGRQVQSSRHCQ